MVSVEWIREFATIVMLAAVGIIAGRNNLQRLLYFLYTFAVWDIFYYVALYLFLDWPSSLLTWDILFLIPVPWIGPVAAPVICSMTMIFMASALIPPIEKGKKVLIKPYQWVLIYSGALIILYTFLRDYLQMIFRSGLLTDSGNTDMKERLWSLMNSYTPGRYSWAMFFSGELLILIAIALVIRQINKKRP